MTSPLLKVLIDLNYIIISGLLIALKDLLTFIVNTITCMYS